MRRSTILSCGCALVLACAGQAMGGLSTRTVALMGTDGVYGPGLGSGVTFTWLGQASLNMSGQAAFSGSTLSGAFGGDGAWLRPDETSTSNNLKLYMNGDVRPGSAPSGPFTAATFPSTSIGYQNLSINNSGQTVARQSNGGIVSTAGTTSGTLTLGRVGYATDVAPGSGGAVYATSMIPASSGPVFNQSGVSMYAGALTGTGVTITSGNNNSVGLFRGTADNANNPNANVSMILRANDFNGIAGLSSTMKVGTSFANLGFNDNGRYFTQNTLQGSGVVTGNGATSNSVALLSNRSGSNAIIAQVGQPAPESSGALSATEVYRGFSSLGSALNNLDHVAFVGSVRTGGTATQTVASAIFSDVNGGSTGGSIKRLYSAGGPIGPVYRVGNNTNPLYEFGNGITFSTSSTFQTIIMNGNDNLLFSANFSSGGQAYLLRDQAGTLHKVIRDGDNIFQSGIDPLTTNGTGTSLVTGFSSFSLNILNQVAFTVQLTGPGVSAGLGNGSALCVVDIDGTLSIIARTGTLFTDALGNTKTISGINVAGSSGGQNGFVTGLSDAGDLVYKLDFTDDTSGVFVTHIPAPGSAGLLALGGLVAARRRRR